MSVSASLTSLSPGGGCACKLPLSKLEGLLGTISSSFQPASKDLLIGAIEGDDAAVMRLDDERAIVLTTDFFTPIVDDPRDWGRIAAANSLSDVYAMGGKPLMAVNVAAWPGDSLPIEMFGDVLLGAGEVAERAQCLIVGGHTIDDPVPKYGMAVVGLAHPDRLFSIDAARPGDTLVLTKPLGTGVVATALKRGSVTDDALQAAVDSMSQLNDVAADAAHARQVRAATDVTGFGLLGHLHRMMAASGTSAEVVASSVPFLPQAERLAADGYISGGTRANVEHLLDHVRVEDGVHEVSSWLLHDAQTSGGLLMAVPDGADKTVADLRAAGLTAAVVGRISDGPAGQVVVRA